MTFSMCFNLTTVEFLGNAPTLGDSVFYGDEGFTFITFINGILVMNGLVLKYHDGNSGFTTPVWGNYQIVNVDSKIAVNGNLAFGTAEVNSTVTIPLAIQNTGTSALTISSINYPTDFSGDWSGGVIAAGGTQKITVTFNPSTVQSYDARVAISDTNGVIITPPISGSGVYAYNYTDSGTEITLTTQNQNQFTGNLLLPSSINGKPVTRIADHAFAPCYGLTSVTIPSSITNIGSGAFSLGPTLTSISVDSANPNYISLRGTLFNKSKTTLIDYVSGKTGVNTIPSSVTSIGDWAFIGASNLTNITIPSSVTNIGIGAFYASEGLIGVTIPSNLTNIGAYAFFESSGLTNITIPTSVTSIGVGAFCSSTLLSITVDAKNINYSSQDGVLFNHSQNTILQYPGGREGSYAIPSNISSIGSYAFCLCSKLSNVMIPQSVNNIGSYAFCGCNMLTNISLPSSITSIEKSTFLECSSLSSVTIPASVTTIGAAAFYQCPLNSVIFLGNAPTLLGDSWFSVPSNRIYYFNGSTGFNGSGYFTYAINLGTYQPTTPWLLSNGLTTNVDLNSTPNHDGVPLLMSYALGLDPTQPQSANIPKPMISGSQMSLTYYAGSAGVTYSVETSSDLQNWSTSGVSTSAPDLNQCCTSSILLSGSHQFMRLRVSY